MVFSTTPFPWFCWGSGWFSLSEESSGEGDIVKMVVNVGTGVAEGGSLIGWRVGFGMGIAL